MNHDYPRNSAGVYLTSVATASPACLLEQEEALSFLLTHYRSRMSRRSRAVLHRVFAHPSVLRRRFALEQPTVLIDEDPDDRIARFTSSAVELAGRAAREALHQAGIQPEAVGGLVVNTCTGYLCPGLSSYLVENLELRPEVQAYDLVGAGCGGALPNLQIGSGVLLQTGRPVLTIAVEICSATFQMGEEASLLLSNGLFADGAAAAVLQPEPKGWEIVDWGSRQVPAHREAIRYVHRQGQLHNHLSEQLPGLIGEVVPELVKTLLQPWGLEPAAVRHWACHGGGAKIIQALQEQLGLTGEQLQPTRKVLAEYGNLSSPSALFCLEEITAHGQVRSGEWCILAAFGAGLAAHAVLLRAH